MLAENQFKETIVVDRPLRTVYNQWTQFEEFPEFMEGVERVQQLDDTHLHWVTEIAGVTREFDAVITEQVPDEIITWRADGEVTQAGNVTFQPVGPDQTRVELTMAWQPEGVLENVAEWFNVAERRVAGDLERFKDFIESRPRETGAHREAH